jgi:hypothetical protein
MEGLRRRVRRYLPQRYNDDCEGFYNLQPKGSELMNPKEYFDHSRKLLEGWEDEKRLQRLQGFWRKMAKSEPFLYNDNIMNETKKEKDTLFDADQNFWNLKKFATPLYDILEARRNHSPGKI